MGAIAAKIARCTTGGGERNTITSRTLAHTALAVADAARPCCRCARAARVRKGLYHVHEPLAWCDLHPYARVAVARIPPVVPYAQLDNGRLALMQNAGLSVAFTVSSPSSVVKRSTRAGWQCSPMTRAPTSVVSSAVARPAWFSHGISRIVARSPVTGSPTPRRPLLACDPADRPVRGALDVLS
jgi:hypothetical protein